MPKSRGKGATKGERGKGSSSASHVHAKKGRKPRRLAEKENPDAR